jgi:hypothetical protein
MSGTFKDKNCKNTKINALKISLFFSNTHSFYIHAFICMFTQPFTPARQVSLKMLISSVVTVP